MAELEVTFTPKPDTPKTLILLKEGGVVRFRLRFLNGPEVRTLTVGVPYSVKWELIGKEGDKLDVAWTATDGQSGKLVREFKIDRSHEDCRPYPGGPYVDYGSNIFQL